MKRYRSITILLIVLLGTVGMSARVPGEQADKNSDGKITGAEAVNKALFNAADMAREGKLTLPELRQYLRNHRGSGQAAEPEKQSGKNNQE